MLVSSGHQAGVRLLHVYCGGHSGIRGFGSAPGLQHFALYAGEADVAQVNCSLEILRWCGVHAYAAAAAYAPAPVPPDVVE